ncbi:hypothetical protein SLA2020_474390 [Shorea laevis]
MNLKSVLRPGKKSDSSTSSSLTSTMIATNTMSVRLQSHNSKAQIVAELKKVFMRFDLNGDSKISSLEVTSILSSLRHLATERWTPTATATPTSRSLWS